MSAGNHAQAVAYHARQLGIPAVIVMPRYTPNIKVEHTRAYGAEVILAGECFDDAAAHALKLIEERNLVLVHPYDDEKVIAGQGTIALEMLRTQPDLDTLVIPIGGGGLISGIAIAAEGRGAGAELRLYGRDPDRAEAVARSLGGVVLAGAADKPHGVREAYILDPEGYCWVPTVAKVSQDVDG